MSHFPLQSAYLCQDCDCIGNCANRCPACTSAALLGLDTVLNREPRTVQDEVIAVMTIYRDSVCSKVGA